MNNCYIPQGYRPPLTGYDMQRAIEFVKSSFQENLKFALNLRRVSPAPPERWSTPWPSGSVWPSNATAFIPATACIRT